MSFLDRFRARTNGEHDATDGDANGQTEQLAPDDPDPRGEDRDAAAGYVLGSLTSTTPTRTTGDTVAVESSPPPDKLGSHLLEYGDFALVDAALQIFADTVLEPGYRVTATVDGETDEEMQEALETWARNCAIHAGQTNQDLGVLLDRLVKRRRKSGTEFMELAGTKGDPDALGALVLHNPATFKQFTRADQTILVQPDDEVADNHPRTPAGEPAAYVQYHDDLSGFDDRDAIAFTQDELLKFVYDANPGDFWGNSLYDKIGTHIDSLRQMWGDRDMAIHQTGHPHRIYFSENWSLRDAKDYSRAHENGEVSAREDTGADDDGRFAGRVDFVSDEVGIETADAQVADISDAVMDNIQSIFSVLPISRFQIAYEENINQFVVEPQQENDALRVDQEREYLRRKFEPIFERKADELAGGTYGGEVEFRVEPSEDENPLRRESFPRENLDSLTGLVDTLARNGALPEGVPAAILDHVGMDTEEIAEEYGFAPDELAQQMVDESTDVAQAQQEAFEAVESDGGENGGEGDGEDTEQ